MARKIQTVHILRVPPLVEGGRCLIVLQSFNDRTVDDDFVVLQFTAHYPECVVLLVVKNLHLAQAGRTARRDPLFLAIVVHHDRGAGTDYALFAHHFLRCAPFQPNRTVPVCVFNCFRLSVPGSPSSSTFYATILLFPRKQQATATFRSKVPTREAGSQLGETRPCSAYCHFD